MKKNFKIIIIFLVAQAFSQDISTYAYRLFYAGVDRAIAGDLDAAYTKFDRCLKLIPFHREAALYKSIIKDVRQDKLNESLAKAIFYALRDLKGSKLNRVEDFTKLIDKEPSYTPLYILRSLEFPEMELALNDLNMAIRKDSTNELVYIYRASLYEKMELSDSALWDYLKAFKLKKNFTLSGFYAARLLSKKGDYDQSIYYFENSLENLNVKIGGIPMYRAYIERGKQRLSENKYSLALTDFDKAIAVNSEWPEAYQNKAVALSKLKRYNYAVQLMDSLLVSDPDNSQLLFNRGMVYFNQEQYPQALVDFERVGELDKTNYQTFYQSGQCAFKLKEYPAAILNFRRAVALKPQAYWAYYWLALAQENNSEYRQAMINYENFLEFAASGTEKHQNFAKERLTELEKWVR